MDTNTIDYALEARIRRICSEERRRRSTERSSLRCEIDRKRWGCQSEISLLKSHLCSRNSQLNLAKSEFSLRFSGVRYSLVLRPRSGDPLLWFVPAPLLIAGVGLLIVELVIHIAGINS